MGVMGVAPHAGRLHLAGPSEFLASNFANGRETSQIWETDFPDPAAVQISTTGDVIFMHCWGNTELSSSRGQMPILYVEAPTSGLWEARVSVHVDQEVFAGFTLLDGDGMMPDVLFGLDKFTASGFGSSGGVASLSYSADFSGTISSHDLGSVSVEWIGLKIVRTGSGRYDLFYIYGSGDAWLAPDDARHSDASVRQRVFVKTAGAAHAEWRPLAQQVASTMSRRIGLCIMTSSGGTARFRDFLVRDMFPQSVASISFDDGQLRESLESVGTVTGISSAEGRDGYSQGALLFTDGTALELQTDPLQLDATETFADTMYANGSLRDFTISLWIKPYSLSSGGILGRRLTQHLTHLPEMSPSISQESNGLQWSIFDEAGLDYSELYETPTQRPYAGDLPTSSSTSLAKVLEVDEWLHVAFVKEADTLFFYRNGKRWGFASLAPDSQLSGSTASAFVLNYIAGIPYHGAVDDLRFYDVGLADFAIEHLFSNADADTLRGKTQRCMAGEDCILSLIGIGLSNQDIYAVLAHCGRYPLIQGVPGLGVSAGNVVYWGTPGLPLTAPGGKYEVCWCGNDGAGGCTAPSDFRVLVGTLLVVGPYSKQQRTCTMGQIAAFDIQGLELAKGDKVQILDTCGIEASNLFDSFNASGDLQPSACYGHVGMGVTETLSSHAHGSGMKGKTQSECCILCQRSLYSDCVAWMHRPSDQTCFLYRIVASVERQEDRVLGFFPAPQTTDALFLATTLTGKRLGADSSGPFAMYVCRSSLDCFGTPLVLTDLSNIEAYQSFQAVVTWPDPWNWNAIKIFSYTSDEWFLESVVVTGNGLSWNFTYSAWLESGAEVFLLRDPPSQYFFGSSGTAETALVASGGQYRLCWCSATSACENSSAFVADAGVLTVRGPVPAQHITCLAGQPGCSLTGLIGTDLSDGDKIMVLNTCGTQIWDGVSLSHHSLVPRFTPDCHSSHCLRDVSCDIRFMNSQYERPALGCGISDPALNGGVDYTWAGDAVAAGGIYRLCWCGNGQSCSIFEHFRVDMGELHLVGPSSTEQHRTCVAGQPCVVSNIDSYLQQTGDKIMILDHCGKAEKECQTNVPLENITLVCGGVERWPGSTVGTGQAHGISEPAVSSAHPCGSSMTWIPFHGSSSCYSVFDSRSWDSAEADCDAIYGGHLVSIGSQDDVDFLVDWVLEPGETYWIGLNDQATEGTFVNTDGTTTFLNWGFLQPQVASSYNTEDCVYISDGLYYDDDCSTSRKYICERSGAFTGSSPGDEFRFGGYQTPRESLIPPSSAGGIYRMCWCARGAQCSQAEDFRMDFGALTLIGPAPLNQHKTCVAGQPCSFDMLGTDLMAGDLVNVLETCGSYVNASQFTHFDSSNDSPLYLPRFPSNGISTSIGTSVSWDEITAMGSRYRLCWCAAGYSCTAAPEFLVDFGRASAAQSWTCSVAEGHVVQWTEGIFIEQWMFSHLSIAFSTAFSMSSYVDYVPHFAGDAEGVPGEARGISNGATDHGTTFVWGGNRRVAISVQI
eukprot:Skav220463  [mRNA]  locus=scaffold3371:94690:102107:- [translate_table: standard]